MFLSGENREFSEVCRSGYALVSCLCLIVLLGCVAMAMLSLSALEVGLDRDVRYREQARENARLGLMVAVGELQRLLGPDQRVSANASLVGDAWGDTASVSPYYLGVWKTSYASGGREWPLVGCLPPGADAPYQQCGALTDLRQSEQALSGGRWKKALHLGWLVSGGGRPDGRRVERAMPSRMVELLGRGTLGGTIEEAEYRRKRVEVEAVEVKVADRLGSYAWYVSDNSQKASIGLADAGAAVQAPEWMSAAGIRPQAMSEGDEVYRLLSRRSRERRKKWLSLSTVALELEDDRQRRNLEERLGGHFHDYTLGAEGLMVDVILGGLKKDLTPLLFGAPQEERIVLAAPAGVPGGRTFASDRAMLPGPGHAVLGPSFGALRYWGRLRYMDGLERGEVPAILGHGDGGSMRYRPVEGWPHGVSDGWTYDGGDWADMAPKLHPVMTDVRWHFYFSHRDEGGLRSHILPRLCLWNPYSTALRCDEMLVLMANPLRRENSFHFVVEPEEAERLKHIYGSDHKALSEWGRLGVGGSYQGPYKIKPSGRAGVGQRSDLFPDARFLVFVLESAVLGPGECLVYSPMIRQADQISQDVRVRAYAPEYVAANRLSAEAMPGRDHYIHDYDGGFVFQAEWPKEEDEGGGQKTSQSGWRPLPAEVLADLKFGRITRYEPWLVLEDNFPFVLKSVDGSTSLSLDDILGRKSARYPTLQLINHGHGGVETSKCWFYSPFWGSSESASGGMFGRLESFHQAPHKVAPALHQFGSKLLWLDESETESLRPPLRVAKWGAEHVAFHPATIAQWNVRPGLVSRSPVSPCARDWYSVSAGAWIRQFAPLAPDDLRDMPRLNARGLFKKSAFGMATSFADCADAVLFDLPSPRWGVLSIGSLRHVALSPYSWHPSYGVGHSLADLHAPYDSTAHRTASQPYRGDERSGWDALIGGSAPYRLAYGPRTRGLNSSGLLQLGSEAVSRRVDGQMLASRDETLAYDLAYEVNHSLWDQYFLSAVPLGSDRSGFEIKLDINGSRVPASMNPMYGYDLDRWNRFKAEVGGGRYGLGEGFWKHASWLKHRAAFNVNSCSVRAWFSFLSSLQGQARPTGSGLSGGGEGSVYARVGVPRKAVESRFCGVQREGGWGGGRILSPAELEVLAREIVDEVRRRGPFMSMSDFVNRRLEPRAEGGAMLCGTLDAAIARSGLNRAYHEPAWLTRVDNRHDANKHDARESWRLDPGKQAASKAWGIPGYLVQGDLLESLAPVMTVRGDSFMVRAYGESRDQGGRVRARAYLQATVVRSHEYLEAARNDGTGNHAIEPALELDRVSGAIHRGRLSETNLKFGRRFRVRSVRWLAEAEV